MDKSESHEKMAAEMKQRLKVDELEENIDELEDVVEDVFPVLIVCVLVCVVLTLVFLLRMYIRYNVECPSNNRMDGKAVLITGGTSGLGKATALELAKRNARVLITGREKSKVEAVARAIRKKTGNQHVNALVLDLANIRSIREFAKDFVKEEKALHVLINNAAYMGPKAATDDGLERGFGVNFLGHFYLTHLLTDKLRKNAPSRIINVVSGSYADGELDLEDLALNKNFNVHKSYARSKLAQVIFNQEYHRRHISGCVWSFGVHPGCVKTELLRSYPGLLGNILRVFARFMFKSPEEGCQTIVYCAVADGLRDFSGKVFSNCKVMKVKDSLVKNRELAKELFKVSAQLCGFEDELAQNAPAHEEKQKDDEEKKKE
ncbi:retinol dehydrogenase 12 [Plakobranchus ocellatus]|uniref:Retinol dehydrogenase 12 n=1 Tax=Plakobranchus ocellatus TaxID=259542 RepID=A0AAV3ZE55_9GAST|nr:retinol dehydrogenase 12 [Plakobranchus ocellatus]